MSGLEFLVWVFSIPSLAFVSSNFLPNKRSGNVLTLGYSCISQSVPNFACLAAYSMATFKPPISSTRPICLAAVPDQTLPGYFCYFCSWDFPSLGNFLQE